MSSTIFISTKPTTKEENYCKVGKLVISTNVVKKLLW